MLWHDVRLALRLLAKDRWYTAVAILTLGLGIGVNNTIFTFVNAVLLRGLPYAEPHRIMHVLSRNAEGNTTQVSYPDFEDWRDQQRTFAEMAVMQQTTMNVSDADRAPERTNGTFISANGFTMLGQQPLLGRNFLPGEDKPGAEGVAIIGFGLWHTRYGGDPSVLGRPLRINEVPVRIVGVMPQGMKFPMNADMWQPLVPQGPLEQRRMRNVGVFGRRPSNGSSFRINCLRVCGRCPGSAPWRWPATFRLAARSGPGSSWTVNPRSSANARRA